MKFVAQIRGIVFGATLYLPSTRSTARVTTCVGRFVDGLVELDDREQVVVTYADDAMTTETVRRCDVTGCRGDGEVSLRHRAINRQCYRHTATAA